MITTEAKPSALRPSIVAEDVAFRVSAPSTDNSRHGMQLVVTVDGPARLDSAEGETHARQAKSSQALDDLVRRLRHTALRYPASAAAQRNYGLALMSVGKFQEAAAVLDTAVQASPQDGPLAFALGRSFSEIGTSDKASRWFLRALELLPDDPSPALQLAQLDLRIGNVDDAIRRLRSVTKAFPGLELARYWLGVALLLSRGGIEAIHHLKIAVRLDPRSADAYHVLGISYAVVGDESRAERAFRSALRLRPNYLEAIEGLVTVLVSAGSLDEAGLVAEGAVSTHPQDSRSHQALARVRFAQRRYAAAKASLYQAATLLAEAGGPGDQLGRVTNNLGVCYRFLGDLAHARQFFERSVAAGGGVDPIPMRNLAAVLIELKAPLKAIEIAQRCVELFPKDDASRRVLAHAFDEAKRPQESVRVLEEWVATGDASAESYAVLGSELLDINQSTRAIETLNKGLVLYPEDLSVKNNLAYTYLVLGRVADARTILDSASNGQPSDRIGAILRATRGLLQLWEGHISEGERLYEEAEQLAADLDESELVAAIRQKGILERAKAHWRLGDSPVALALTRQGLAIQGRPKFRVELTDLQKELMKGSQNPLVTRD